MKKTGVMNSNISRVIADMGHMDWLGVGDAGTPVPAETEKIDLSVRPGLPSFIDVLEEVLKELEVQKMYIAEEIKTENPKQLEAIKKAVPNVEIEFIPHSELKKDCTEIYNNGGKISVNSNLGEGTSFEIILPIME